MDFIINNHLVALQKVLKISHMLLMALLVYSLVKISKIKSLSRRKSVTDKKFKFKSTS